MSLSHSVTFNFFPFQSNNEKLGVIQPHLESFIFGHYPCPDDLSAMICLKQKFERIGINASCLPFNHISDTQTMLQIIMTALKKKDANLIFVDIIPKQEIIVNILENTGCTVTLLDHHDTAIEQVEHTENKKFFDRYLNENPSRLQIILNPKRSGIGIAYAYAHGHEEYPPHYRLIQAMDIFTATANLNFLKEIFDKNKLKLDEKAIKIIEKLLTIPEVSDNIIIKNNIEFFALAAELDDKMKTIMSLYPQKSFAELMEIMTEFFKFIQIKGLSVLLEPYNMIENFKRQIEYQAIAIKEATIVPSGISENFNILFVDANIQSGRTFDALLQEKLNTLSYPTIAMIVDLRNAKKDIWVSLRASSNTFDLERIASQYKEAGLASNAGGHKRASAMQLTIKQLEILSELLNISQSVPIKKYF